MSAHPKPNQSCPCGSGLKYKKCCGNPDKVSDIGFRQGALGPDSPNQPNLREMAQPSRDDSFVPEDEGDGWEEEERYEWELFGTWLRETLNVETIQKMLVTFGEMLIYDPFYKGFQFDQEDNIKLQHLFLKNQTRQEPIDFETGEGRKTLTSILKKKRYAFLLDDAYEQLTCDYEATGSMDCKKIYYLLASDIEMQEASTSKDPTLFWIQMAKVSMYKSLATIACEMKEIRYSLACLKTLPALWTDLGHSPETLPEGEMTQIEVNSPTFTQLEKKVAHSFSRLADSIKSGEVTVSLPEEWALPGIVVAALARLYPIRFPIQDETPSVLSDLSFYLEGSVFLTDCQAALRQYNQIQTETPEGRELELARRLFCETDLSRFISSGKRRVLNALIQQFYAPFESLAQRYPRQAALLESCDNLDLAGQDQWVEQVVGDNAIEAALEAGNPSRAASLAASALLCSLEVPERRFHFAKRLAGMATPEPGDEDEI